MVVGVIQPALAARSETTRNSAAGSTDLPCRCRGYQLPPPGDGDALPAQPPGSRPPAQRNVF